MTLVYVRCASHRARNRLSAYRVDDHEFWHWDRPNLYGICLIDESDLAEARKIPGVTKCREQTGWNKCWSMGG